MKDSEKLVCKLWPFLSKGIQLFNGDTVRKLDIEAYYEYYNHLYGGVIKPIEESPDAQSSYFDIIPLMQALQKGWTREAAMSSLRSRTPPLSDETSGNLLNLAARLLSMLQCGTFKNRSNPCGHLDWTTGSLGDFVKKHLEVSPTLGCDSIQLPEFFNAWSIAVIAGIEIEFTDHVADHLLLIEDDTRLLIFHHVSFLELQRNLVFSDRFVDETLQTLALLFPEAQFKRSSGRFFLSGSKRKWFRTLKKEHDKKLDPRLTLCGTLDKRQVRDFEIWRDRLVKLKQAFDKAKPRTFTQWWYDERDGVQWSTFWAAILVLIITTFLGIIQCIEGALQVYKAFS